MIEFLKETGMAILWLFVGYLVGEKNFRDKGLSKMKKPDCPCQVTSPCLICEEEICR